MILGRAWDAEGVRSWHLLSHPGIRRQSRSPSPSDCFASSAVY
jgi:hypothetical protein